MPLEEEDEPPEGEDKPKVLSASLLNVILGASMKIVKKLLIDSILFFFLNSILCKLLQSQKKKPKKDPLMMKKSKNDPHAPAFNRIPLPEM